MKGRISIICMKAPFSPLLALPPLPCCPPLPSPNHSPYCTAVQPITEPAAARPPGYAATQAHKLFSQPHCDTCLTLPAYNTYYTHYTRISEFLISNDTCKDARRNTQQLRGPCALGTFVRRRHLCAGNLITTRSAVCLSSHMQLHSECLQFHKQLPTLQAVVHSPTLNTLHSYLSTILC